MHAACAEALNVAMQEAAGNDAWEHINRPCCSDLEEASSPAAHIIMEDVMRPASGQELRDTTNEPRSQVPASRDQQLDNASIDGSDQAADSSDAETGDSPMACADLSSLQAAAAQVSQNRCVRMLPLTLSVRIGFNAPVVSCMAAADLPPCIVMLQIM